MESQNIIKLIGTKDITLLFEMILKLKEYHKDRIVITFEDESSEDWAIIKIKNITCFKEEKFYIYKFVPPLKEEFYNFTLKICELSYSAVPNLQTQFGYEIDKSKWPENMPKEVESTIHSLIFYKWTENFDNLDIISASIDLMEKITQNHFLPNGNKRFAVLTAILFVSLTFNPILLPDTLRDKSDIKKWEKIILELTTRRKHNVKDGEFIMTNMNIDRAEIYRAVRILFLESATIPDYLLYNI